MAVLILIALGALAVNAARLYLFPFRNCKKCGGTGRKYSRLNRRTFDTCPACAGAGQTLRPGARAIHKAVLSARSPAARDRLRRRETGTTERTQVPGRPARRQASSPERSNP